MPRLPSNAEAVVVGAGPAGLFAAKSLAERGADVVVIEAGPRVESRNCLLDQSALLGDPVCDCPYCSILEGVGGAGGFSDGKLTFDLKRGTQGRDFYSDREAAGRHLAAVRGFVEDTIPEEERLEPDVPEPVDHGGLRLSGYPLVHVGTDGIQRVTARLQDQVEQSCQLRTRRPVTNIAQDWQGNWAVWCHYDHIKTENLILATGMQGMPWAEEWLSRQGIKPIAGPSGYGMRIEVPSLRVEGLFDYFYDWKLEYGAPGGDWVRSFCCNHRGQVLVENHNHGYWRNVNGHSYRDPELRTDKSNFAVIMEWWGDDNLDSAAEARDWARRVCDLGGGMPVVAPLSRLLGAEGAMLTRTCQAAVRRDDWLDEAYDDHQKEVLTDYFRQLNQLSPGLTEHAWAYGPEIKYWGRRQPIDPATMRLEGLSGVQLVGNATGWTDSWVSAAITGIIAGNAIERT